jgi:hypothetical protein
MKKFYTIGRVLACGTVVRLLIASCVFAASAGQIKPIATPDGVKFSYFSDTAGKVCIAGEFNNWNPDKDPLAMTEAGLWEVVYPLTEGRHEYKFVVDGKWTEGDNLVVTVEKKNGKLSVAKEKPAEMSSERKIEVSGKFDVLLYSAYNNDEGAWRMGSDSSSVHLDLDMKASMFGRASTYARGEVESASGDFNFRFKQGNFTFTPEGLQLKAYYNEKTLQFDDPLKLLDSEVSLRYDGIYFSDELNPHRGYGLGTQGISIDSGLLGAQGRFFYSDVKDTGADDVGVRLKKSFDQVSLGASFLIKRGVKWPYAGSSGWFDDPAVIPEGRSYDASFSTQPWYKGYVEQRYAGMDVRIRMPGSFWLFSEYMLKHSQLSASRTNAGTGVDIVSDKNWLLADTSEILAGLKASPFEKISAELTYDYQDHVLGKELYSGFKGNTGTVKAVVKYSGNPSAGIRIESSSSKKIDGITYIDGALHPYYRQTAFYSYSSSVPYILAERSSIVMPFAAFNSKYASFRLISSIKSYSGRAVSISSGTYYADPASRLASTRIYEAILEGNVKLYGDLYLEDSSRYSRYSSAGGANISHFLALRYKIGDSAYVKLGWGVDPENVDEDIYIDIDKRDEFLYNRYIETGSVYKAERMLELERRISLKTEMRF